MSCVPFHGPSTTMGFCCAGGDVRGNPRTMGVCSPAYIISIKQSEAPRDKPGAFLRLFRKHSAISPRHFCAIICRMKILSSSAELEQDAQRAVGKGRRIIWGAYLIGAVSLFMLWFVADSVMLSYLFGGWIVIGTLVLWFIEDTVEN